MFKSLVAAVGLFALVGCAATEDETEGVQEDQLRANGNDGFWQVVEQDHRRCAFPACGGVYVAKVNGALTRCADGSVANRCYVAELRFDKLGLPEQQAADLVEQAKAGHVLLRAPRITRALFEDVGSQSLAARRFPVLDAEEAWLRFAPSEDHPAEGTVYRATDSGIRCITAPCPSLTVAKLNGRKTANIHNIDLSTVTPQPSQEELDAAWAALSEGGFLFASTDTGRDRAANAVYTRVLPREEEEEPTEQACGSRGLGECPEGQACIFSVEAACGTFDAPGVCRSVGLMCPAIHDPVCGCNGKTYPSACVANAAGVSVASAGECAPPKPCFVGGCSGQVCSEREGVISTCQWREEYACYRGATCERQENGSCGWTQTDELRSCIERSR